MCWAAGWTPLCGDVQQVLVKSVTEYGPVCDRAGSVARDHKTLTDTVERPESNLKICGRVCLCLPPSDISYVARSRPSLTPLSWSVNRMTSSRPVSLVEGHSVTLRRVPSLTECSYQT